MDDPSRAPGSTTFDHVDVFADRALAGNGLTVVRSERPLDAETMLRVAQELRQFETIFLLDVEGDRAEARIFTPEEELDFAGHPLLGAAAVLHRRTRPHAPDGRWTITVAGRQVVVRTSLRGDGVVSTEMDQGRPLLLPALPGDAVRRFAEALGVPTDEVRTDLPTQVVSTGLPYLILPVTTTGLAASHVAASNLPDLLATVGADFVYVLDPDRPEGRTWDNRGVTEDVATGSAAGPTAGYLIEHGRRPPTGSFEVHQGRFVERPSRMTVRRAEDGSVHVGGPVTPFSSGTLEPRVLAG